MQCVLRDKFRLYPNAEDDYDVTLYESSLVFEPCVKGKGLAQYRARTEVKLEDVIGCHVMRERVVLLCLRLPPDSEEEAEPVPATPEKDVRFAVDQSDEYEANLAVSRVWQSAFLWLLAGVKPERGGGEFICLRA
ncbi:hypothetical protein HPB52_006548 [Rhipicephalus sanguineus]|uniref:Uncharacterized protein n=1 Tax=Rhipicephalus sanguineus TaxID=34632 RepID=A0A9D4PKA4_RHISA|nr:hypothetical protein HPB52_006548 [Rhipicephalus sanguineus]